MKNSLYIIAGLLIVLWGVVTYEFYSFRFIDILIPIAGFIILFRIFYSNKIT